MSVSSNANIRPREIQLRLPGWKLRLAARLWDGTNEDFSREFVGEDPEGVRTVLALHGWLDNAASFDHLAGLLAEDPGLRIIAVDLPGHGRSDHRPLAVQQHFIDYVSVVLQICEALGLERLSLLGHSMGAGIACLFAGAFPERVRRLVLIEGLGPWSESPGDAPERVARAARSSLQTPALSPIYSTLDQAIRVRQRAGRLPDDAARRMVERNMRPAMPEELEAAEFDGSGGFVWRTDPRLKEPSALRMSEEQVEAFLQRISAPVLFLAGEESEFESYRPMLERRMQKVARLQQQKLPGGHHLHMDSPDDTAFALRDFWKQPEA